MHIIAVCFKLRSVKFITTVRYGHEDPRSIGADSEQRIIL